MESKGLKHFESENVHKGMIYSTFCFIDYFFHLVVLPLVKPGQDNVGFTEGLGQGNVAWVSDDLYNEEVPLILGLKWRQLILIICLFCLRTVTVLQTFVGQLLTHYKRELSSSKYKLSTNIELASLASWINFTNIWHLRYIVSR